MTTKSHQQVMVEIDEIHHILPDRRLDQLLVYETTQQLFRIRGYVRNDGEGNKWTLTTYQTAIVVVHGDKTRLNSDYVRIFV